MDLDLSPNETQQNVSAFDPYGFSEPSRWKEMRQRHASLSNDESKREIKEVAYLSQGHLIDSNADCVLDLRKKENFE